MKLADLIKTPPQRVLDAFADRYDYKDMLPTEDTNVEIPNPVSKEKFFKQQINDHIKQVVREYEANQAATLAREEAITKVDNELSLEA